MTDRNSQKPPVLGTTLGIQPEAVFGIYAAQLLKETFSSKSETAAFRAELHGTCKPWLLGSNLKVACRLLGHLLPDATQLANQHTVLPLAEAFAPTHVAAVLRRQVTGEGVAVRSRLLTDLGRTTYAMGAAVCFDCLAEQRLEFGATFWKRITVIPACPLCPRHGCPTRRLCLTCRMAVTKQGFVPPPSERCLCGTSLLRPKPMDGGISLWLGIVTDMQAVLDGMLRGVPMEAMLEAIRTRLRDLDIGLGNNGRAHELLSDSGLGPVLSIGMRGVSQAKFQRVMFGHEFAQSPVVNIAVIRAMFGSIQAMLDDLHTAETTATAPDAAGRAEHQTRHPGSVRSRGGSEGREETAVSRDEGRIQVDRQVVAAIVSRTPRLTLEALPSAWNNELPYLALHDTDWLEAIFWKKRNERLATRWSERDARFARLIRAEAERLWQQVERPRITRRLLLERVGFRLLHRDWGHYPLCHAELDRQAETTTQWRRASLRMRLTRCPQLRRGIFALTDAQISRLPNRRIDYLWAYLYNRERKHAQA